MDIDEIIELYNDGNLDTDKYFNDTETFFKIIENLIVNNLHLKMIRCIGLPQSIKNK